MKIERPPHPADVRRAELPKKASSIRTSADGVKEYASFSAQLAARTEKLRADAAAAPRTDWEEFTEPSPGFLSRRALAIGGGGLSLLALSGALIVWGPSFESRRSLSPNRIEQAKADVPSAARPEAKIKPPEPAPVAVTPITPPAPPPPARQDIVKSNVDITPASPPMPPTAPATVQALATAVPLTRDEIRDLQGRLKVAGFDPGPVDGSLGTQTRGAARKYAEARVLPNADTRELLSRLKTEQPAAPAAPPAAAAAAALAATPAIAPTAAPVAAPTAAPAALPADKPTAEPARDPSSLTPDEIRDLQDRLKAAGFNPGASDGTMGRQTRSAIREYADARSLPNADISKELLARVRAETPAPAASSAAPSAATSASPAATLENANALTPDEIRDLQSRLKAIGFNPGASDGTIGRQTRGALREYADARSLGTTDVRDLFSHLKAETP
jgi:peptidoglycan hydrolase-like protein with peptidoglycan-binding domain